MNLKNTQKLIWRLLKAPDGIGKALQNKKLSIPIKPSKKLTAEERLDIYANMYFFRIRDALIDDYKACYHLLGVEGFHHLITHYLLKHPSQHYSLRYMGEKLPAFIKKQSLSRKKLFSPFLTDVATLEWAIIDSFDAPDENILSFDFIKKLTPEKWTKLTLQTASCVYLIESSWPLKMIYDTAIKKKMLPQIKKEKTYLCVWRHDFKVYYRTLSKLEWSLLGWMKKGISVNAFSELVSKNVGGTLAPQETARLVQKWINDKIIICP